MHRETICKIRINSTASSVRISTLLTLMRTTTVVTGDQRGAPREWFWRVALLGHPEGGFSAAQNSYILDFVSVLINVFVWHDGIYPDVCHG